MENLNLIVSKNLIKFRMAAGLTQLELAQKINYSDKSISKWERGEGLPDLSVLVLLSKIYKITVNDFLIEEHKTSTLPKKEEKKSRLLISFLSVGLVVLVASIVFAVLFIIPKTKNFAWLSYLYSLPVSAIVLLVFSEIWGNRYLNTLFASIIVWGIILSICITVKINDIWIICIIGIVLTILIIFWYLLRHIHFKKQKALKFINNIFNKKKVVKKDKLKKENEENLNLKNSKTLVYNSLNDESEQKN